MIFPSIPGELDLPLLVDAAATARAAGKGIWSDPATLPAYEYRAMEKLYAITKKIVAGEEVRGADRFAWRERYCADMRNRQLHGPEDYVDVPPEYRLWIWPADVAAAVEPAQPRPRAGAGRGGLTASPAGTARPGRRRRVRRV